MKVRLALLSIALVGAIGATMPATAQDASKDAAATKTATKEAKWQGHIVRIDKDHSMIDLRGGPAPAHDLRKVAFDDKTEWTKLSKPAQMDEFKEKSFVIVVGHVDDKGIMHATRVDLRLPR